MSARTIRLDASRWPLVVVRMVGESTDADFAAYLADASTCLARASPHLYIFDTLQASAPSWSQRRRQADWFRENWAASQDYILGFALAINGPIFRLVLSSILLLQGLPAAYEIFKTVPQCESWARHRLLTAGLTMPRAGNDAMMESSRLHLSISPVWPRGEYTVLAIEERKSATRILYRHTPCDQATRPPLDVADTLETDPSYYSEIYCCFCREWRPCGRRGEFTWVAEPTRKVGT